MFMRWVDFDNINAQSLNAREIAMRPDPEPFECTLFYERDADPRLKGWSNIRLIRVHPRLQTWVLLREMLRMSDIVSYLSLSTASYLFLRLPQMFRRVVVTVHHAEGPLAQAEDTRGWSRFLADRVRARCEMHSAITEFVRQDLAKEGMHAHAVLPVGVDTRLFRTIPPQEQTAGQPYCLPAH
jgi:hypothetical protein